MDSIAYVNGTDMRYIDMLKRIVLYRARPHLITYDNIAAVGMAQLALALLAYPGQGTAAYFALFSQWLTVEVMALWMLLSAAVMAFRRLSATGLTLVSLPVLAYAFVVIRVTTTTPGLPLTPITGWLLILLLIIAATVERAHDDDTR